MKGVWVVLNSRTALDLQSICTVTEKKNKKQTTKNQKPDSLNIHNIEAYFCFFYKGLK